MTNLALKATPKENTLLSLELSSRILIIPID